MSLQELTTEVKYVKAKVAKLDKQLNDPETGLNIKHDRTSQLLKRIDKVQWLVLGAIILPLLYKWIS